MFPVGLLSSVGELSHYFIDSSSLNISWNPPFTLPGTHITGYNISVTSIMFNISQFITDTYYVLTAPDNTDPCDEISITVSGYNGAGNGEMTTISSLYFSAGDQYVLVCCGIYLYSDYTMPYRPRGLKPYQL